MAAGRRLVQLATLGLCALLASRAAAEPLPERELFGTICADKAGTRLEHLSQARRLAARAPEIKRCANYVQALRELDQLVASVEAGHTCSMDFIQAARDFHYTHVFDHPSRADKVPHAVRLFFMSMLYEASAVCKVELVARLAGAAEGRVQDADFEAVEPVLAFTPKVMKMDTSVDEVADIELTGRYVDTYGSGFAFEGRRCLAARVHNSLELNTAAAVCANKFRPIYAQLILPLVHLARMGYDFNAAPDNNYYATFQRLLEPQFKRWFTTTQACEVAATVRVVEEPDAKMRSTHVATVIGSAEFERLRATDAGWAEAARQAPAPVHYQAQPVMLADKLWLEDQTEIEKKILGDRHYHLHLNMHLHEMAAGAKSLMHNPFHTKHSS